MLNETPPIYYTNEDLQLKLNKRIPRDVPIMRISFYTSPPPCTVSSKGIRSEMSSVTVLTLTYVRVVYKINKYDRDVYWVLAEYEDDFRDLKF
jgi:hypothetical protein